MNGPEGNNDILLIATKLDRQQALRSEQVIDVDIDPGLKTVKEKNLDESALQMTWSLNQLLSILLFN